VTGIELAALIVVAVTGTALVLIGEALRQR